VRATLRILGVVLLLATVCEGAGIVHLDSRSGYVGNVGSRFRFKISIQRDAKNRLFCLMWASPASEGSSCDELAGEAAPLTIWRDITFRTGGEFNVMATVRQNDGKDHISNIETILITSPY
jgi:hypothetical protein